MRENHRETVKTGLWSITSRTGASAGGTFLSSEIGTSGLGPAKFETGTPTTDLDCKVFSAMTIFNELSRSGYLSNGSHCHSRNAPIYGF